MEKRKVLFVIHQLNHGGVQKALISALHAIDYEQNEVTLYVRKNRIQLLDDINKNVSKIIVNQDKTHYYRKPFAAMLLLGKCVSKVVGNVKWEETIQKRLVSYVNESQMKYEKQHYFKNNKEYDVAVSYIQGYTAQFVAEYINAKKKVMFYHGSTDETHELHEQVMPRFDAIVGVNKNVQAILAKLYPRCAEKMTYLENYVDTDEIRRKSNEYEITKKEGKIILCSCGRLTLVKGFDMAVKAAKILKEKNQEFFWYFVGDGPERTKLENLIREYALQDYIEITGMQDNPYPFIKECDIYVQPSYEEAHPLTIMEALRLCKPVITTATVGGSALVRNRESGLIVDIEGRKIADGIKFLIDDTQLFGKIMCHLKKCDYSKSFDAYKDSWKRLLEE